MEYYLVIKRNEILVCPMTCMNYENVMLSKRNKTQKITYGMILFIGNVEHEYDMVIVLYQFEYR